MQKNGFEVFEVDEQTKIEEYKAEDGKNIHIEESSKESEAI